MEKKKIQLSDIPVSLWKRFKIHCVEKDISMTQRIIQLINADLKTNDKNF